MKKMRKKSKNHAVTTKPTEIETLNKTNNASSSQVITATERDQDNKTTNESACPVTTATESDQNNKAIHESTCQITSTESNKSNKVIVEASNLSFVYSVKSPFEKVALKDISFKIYEGETVGIIGSTGSGKSTLVQHLNGLIKVTKGSLNVCGFDLSARKVKYKELRKKIGMLFQYPEYQLFEETVIKDVSFGPKNFGFTKEEATLAAEEAIKMVGLDLNEVGEKSPFELSGGQQRRVAIAGVIASRPEILVLDEPTSGLDPQGKKAILELVEELKKSFCKTVIMISHNMDEIAKYCERVIVLNEGQIVFDGTQKEFFKDPKNIEGTGLKLPQTVALREDLKARGIDISDDCLTVDEVVDAIEKSGILKTAKMAEITEGKTNTEDHNVDETEPNFDCDGGEK